MNEYSSTHIAHMILSFIFSTIYKRHAYPWPQLFFKEINLLTISVLLRSSLTIYLTFIKSNIHRLLTDMLLKNKVFFILKVNLLMKEHPHLLAVYDKNIEIDCFHLNQPVVEVYLVHNHDESSLNWPCIFFCLHQELEINIKKTLSLHV